MFSIEILALLRTALTRSRSEYIEISTNHELSPVPGGHVSKDIPRRIRVVIDDQQSWLCLSGKIGQLRGGCMVLSGKSLKGGRPSRYPCWRVCFVDQNVAAVARINCCLRGVRISRDNYGAI